MRRPALILCCLLAAVLAWPAAASAGDSQEAIFQDDRLLLFSGDATREETLDRLQALGADTIRAFVFWSSVAPEPTSTRRPPGFDGANPRS